MRWLSRLWRKIRKFFGRKSKRKEKDVSFGIETRDENGVIDFVADGSTFSVAKMFRVTGNHDLQFSSSLPLGFIILPIKADEQQVISPITCSFSGGYIRTRYERFQLRKNGEWTVNVPADIIVYFRR